MNGQWRRALEWLLLARPVPKSSAANVLADGDYAGRVYELAGDTAFTLAELVAVVSQASGKPIVYENLTPEDFKSAAAKARAPEMVAITAIATYGYFSLAEQQDRLPRAL